MSKRDWIKYAALGIVTALVALAWGGSEYWQYRLENHSKRQYAASQDTAKHQKNLEFNCVLIDKAEARCALTSHDTEGADEHTKADLKAQQDVAEWSFLGVLLSGLGIFLSALAVAFTGWAAWAAAIAARAARESVTDSRESASEEANRFAAQLAIANATAIAARESAEAAQAALKDSRDNRRAWVTLSMQPLPSLSYENGSTLMMGVSIKAENVGGSPAMDLAIEGKIKIIPKTKGGGIGTEDFIDLLREVAVSASQQSVARNLTETVFFGRGAALKQTRYFHAHLSDSDIVGHEVGLVICVAISYKIPSGHGGAIWHGVIRSERGMFADHVTAAKANPIAVNVFSQPVTYY